MKFNDEFNTDLLFKQQQIFKTEKSLLANAFKKSIVKKSNFIAGVFKGLLTEVRNKK